MTPCKHCGMLIVFYAATKEIPGAWVHKNGLYRCDPDKTGQPYGLEAEPK